MVRIALKVSTQRVASAHSAMKRTRLAARGSQAGGIGAKDGPEGKLHGNGSTLDENASSVPEPHDRVL
ncbi:hypothetical protein ACTMU2_35125 [Cupriavidus basilensis]